MLIGQLPLASGVREEGETTVIGHFTQQPPELPPNLRIIDYIRCVSKRGEGIPLGKLGCSEASTQSEEGKTTCSRAQAG